MGQTTHRVEFSESVSESSSVSWRTVEIQLEGKRSVDISSESSFGFRLSDKPELVMEMSDIQVKSGEMAEFSCSFSGQPFTGVVWDHNGRSLTDTERVRSSQMGEMLSLIIQGVGMADQGVYRCTAGNQYGKNSTSAKLTVEGG